MSENWKKKEKFYALQWGMIGYNETEQFRPGKTVLGVLNID